MKGLAVLAGATLGGIVGWWLGVLVGPMTGYLVSTIGAGAGIYAARRWNALYLP